MDAIGYLLRETYHSDGYVIVDGMYDEGPSFFAYHDNYGGMPHFEFWDGLAEKMAAWKTMGFTAYSKGDWTAEKGERYGFSYYDGMGEKPTVKMTVSKKGVVKVSGKIAGLSVSGSAMLVPTYDGDYHLKAWIPVTSGGKSILLIPSFSINWDETYGVGGEAYLK